MWKIGNIEIKNRIVFAPMAGISDESYRTIIKEICYFHERNLSALGRLLKFSFVPTGFL